MTSTIRKTPLNAKNTAPAKRLTFLNKFLPFLRERLSQRLIIDTLSGAAGLANDVTNVLLSDILTAGAPPQPAMKVLETVKYQPSPGSSNWKGYLIPTLDAEYTFVITGDTQPVPLSIAGQLLSFSSPIVPADPCSNDPKQWSSDPIKLKNGTLYALEVADRSADELKWKTAITPLVLSQP